MWSEDDGGNMYYLVCKVKLQSILQQIPWSCNMRLWYTSCYVVYKRVCTGVGYTFLCDGISLRVHAQHEVATGQIAHYLRGTVLFLDQGCILLQID